MDQPAIYSKRVNQVFFTATVDTAHIGKLYKSFQGEHLVPVTPIAAISILKFQQKTNDWFSKVQENTNQDGPVICIGGGKQMKASTVLIPHKNDKTKMLKCLNIQVSDSDKNTSFVMIRSEFVALCEMIAEYSELLAEFVRDVDHLKRHNLSCPSCHAVKFGFRRTRILELASFPTYDHAASAWLKEFRLFWGVSPKPEAEGELHVILRGIPRSTSGDLPDYDEDDEQGICCCSC